MHEPCLRPLALRGAPDGRSRKGHTREEGVPKMGRIPAGHIRQGEKLAAPETTASLMICGNGGKIGHSKGGIPLDRVVLPGGIDGTGSDRDRIGEAVHWDGHKLLQGLVWCPFEEI